MSAFSYYKVNSGTRRDFRYRVLSVRYRTLPAAYWTEFPPFVDLESRRLENSQANHAA